MPRSLRDYPLIALNPEQPDGRVDFTHVFGRTGTVHIEIGIGRGTFLLNEAIGHPEVDFLGIELASRYYRHSVDRMGRHGLGNVRIVRTEAAYFLTEMVRDSSVDCFHIYFPDPWPKKRHHKRRFINQTNLEQLLRCLKNNGLIKIVTDHAGYFEQIEQVIAAHSRQLAKTDFLPAGNSADGEWVGTNFERKYRKENRQIFCLAVIKTGLG